MTPVDVVRAQLAAYNRQDLESYMACFAPSALIATVEGGVETVGAAAIRARYERLFAEYPKNRARLLHRIAFNDRVIDHERVVRGPGTAPFEVAAIYTVQDGLITRVDFVR